MQTRLFIISIILSVCSLSSKAATEVTVSDADDLVALAATVKANGGEYAVTQTADIDMSGVEGFVGIGTFDHPFIGSYDGGGHTISNMTIASSDLTVERVRNEAGSTIINPAVYLGLFAVTSSSDDFETTEIKNLAIDSTCSVTYTGDSSQTTYIYVGAFVGRAVGSTTLSYCENHAAVRGYGVAGGLIGQMGYMGGSSSSYGEQSNNPISEYTVTVDRCVNYGTVTAVSYGNAAGLIGASTNDTSIYTVVSNSANHGAVTGHNRASAVLWNNGSDNYSGNCSLYNLYNTGTLATTYTAGNAYLSFANDNGYGKLTHSNCWDTTDERNYTRITVGTFTDDDLAYGRFMYNFAAGAAEGVDFAWGQRLWGDEADPCPVIGGPAVSPLTVGYAFVSPMEGRALSATARRNDGSGEGRTALTWHYRTLDGTEVTGSPAVGADYVAAVTAPFTFDDLYANNYALSLQMNGEEASLSLADDGAGTIYKTYTATELTDSEEARIESQSGVVEGATVSEAAPYADGEYMPMGPTSPFLMSNVGQTLFDVSNNTTTYEPTLSRNTSTNMISTTFNDACYGRDKKTGARYMYVLSYAGDFLSFSVARHPIGESGLEAADKTSETVTFARHEYGVKNWAYAAAVKDYSGKLFYQHYTGQFLNPIRHGAPNSFISCRTTHIGANYSFGTIGFGSNKEYDDWDIADDVSHDYASYHDLFDSANKYRQGEFFHMQESMSAVDVNGDGVDDLILNIGVRTYIYDGATMELLESINADFGKSSQYIGGGLSVGVTGDAIRYYSEEYDTEEITWHKELMAGSTVFDVNGDGIPDYIGVTAGNDVIEDSDKGIVIYQDLSVAAYGDIGNTGMGNFGAAKMWILAICPDGNGGYTKYTKFMYASDIGFTDVRSIMAAGVSLTPVKLGASQSEPERLAISCNSLRYRASEGGYNAQIRRPSSYSSDKSIDYKTLNGVRCYYYINPSRLSNQDHTAYNYFELKFFDVSVEDGDLKFTTVYDGLTWSRDFFHFKWHYNNSSSNYDNDMWNFHNYPTVLGPVALKQAYLEGQGTVPYLFWVDRIYRWNPDTKELEQKWSPSKPVQDYRGTEGTDYEYDSGEKDYYKNSQYYTYSTINSKGEVSTESTSDEVFFDRIGNSRVEVVAYGDADSYDPTGRECFVYQTVDSKLYFDYTDDFDLPENSTWISDDVYMAYTSDYRVNFTASYVNPSTGQLMQKTMVENIFNGLPVLQQTKGTGDPTYQETLAAAPVTSGAKLSLQSEEVTVSDPSIELVAAAPPTVEGYAANGGVTMGYTAGTAASISSVGAYTDGDGTGAGALRWALRYCWTNQDALYTATGFSYTDTNDNYTTNSDYVVYNTVAADKYTYTITECSDASLVGKTLTLLKANGDAERSVATVDEFNEFYGGTGIQQIGSDILGHTIGTPSSYRQIIDSGSGADAAALAREQFGVRDGDLLRVSDYVALTGGSTATFTLTPAGGSTDDATSSATIDAPLDFRPVASTDSLFTFRQTGTTSADTWQLERALSSDDAITATVALKDGATTSYGARLVLYRKHFTDSNGNEEQDFIVANWLLSGVEEAEPECYTVAEALALCDSGEIPDGEIWVKGYLRGSCPADTGRDALWGAPAADSSTQHNAYNVILADESTSTDTKTMLPVELSTAKMREINLQGVTSSSTDRKYLDYQVMVYGNLSDWYRRGAGMPSTSDYRILSEVSGVEEIAAGGSSERPADNRIYSADGRFMGYDRSALAPGFYIQNGKKFIKKH